MRTILKASYDYYAVALKKKKWTPEQRNKKLAALKEELQFVDKRLDGVSLSESDEFDGPETKLQETLTSGDFPNAIGEFVNRKLIEGYTQKRFEFEPLVKPDTLVNFLPHTRYQNREQFDDLEYVADKGAMRPGSIADATKRQYKVEVWAKQLDISWRTLRNDDLGYFNDTVTKMGRAARRTQEKFVSRLITNAVTQARLLALGALYYTTGRLNAARIDTAISAFNQRTDDAGNPITAKMSYLVYHSGLDGTVWQIKNTTGMPVEPGTANYGANRALRTGWTPIENPYLVGTAPNLPWYALSDPMADGIAANVLARLQNWPGPRTLRKKSDIEYVTSLVGPGTVADTLMGDFASMNLKFGVMDIWGTFIDAVEGNLFDYRGAYSSTGTTP